MISADAMNQCARRAAKASMDEIITISDQIFDSQPFMLSLFLGLVEDIKNPEARDEVIRIMYIIWFALPHPEILVTESRYTKRLLVHARFLKFLENERDMNAFSKYVEKQQESLREQYLWTVISAAITQGYSGIGPLPEDCQPDVLFALFPLIEVIGDLKC